MDTIVFLIFIFFIGAIPFAEYAGKLIKPKEALKLAVKLKAQSKLYFLFDPWVGVAVNLLDVLKAFLVIYLANNYYNNYFVTALSAFVVVLGHIFSPFAKKIRSNSLPCLIGALAALDFKLFLMAGLGYILILSFFHYTRLALLLLSLILPIVAYFICENIFTVMFLLLSFILLVINYLPNIRNFLQGRELTAVEEFKRRNYPT
jgi:glycerol-3-phosphate acyltransferase PlsY